MQALTSFALDVGMLMLLFLGTIRRSSVRSVLSLFLFMRIRFIAQLMALPCPPGFLWPHGKLFGVHMPTFFIDYHPANNMFFSGHTGTALIVGLELFQMGYLRTAWIQLFLVTPLVTVVVVAFRVHRGIDVLAGLLAAITSCSIAKEVAESLDRALQVRRNKQLRA